MDHRKHPLTPLLWVLKIKRGLQQVVVPHETGVPEALIIGRREILLQRVGDVIRVADVSRVAAERSPTRSRSSSTGQPGRTSYAVCFVSDSKGGKDPPSLLRGVVRLLGDR